MIRKKTEKQLLIEKFCKPESINWPSEMKILVGLLKMEPIEFWKFLVLGFKLNSLAWFKSKEGKAEIAKNKKLFKTLQTKPTETFIENFEYEKTEVAPKPTLRDRLLK